MNTFNIGTRRWFLDRSFKVGLGVALSTLVDIPFVVKRALAEGTIGNGKKLLFIFLRGGNDALNSVIPIQDTSYATSRTTLAISKDGSTNYTLASGTMDFPQSSSDPNTQPDFQTFYYSNAIRAGNGFAAVHPSLKFLAPVFNAGDLSLVHRVGYPKQSRSHFDSQNYWENGNPNNNLIKDGIFYRTMIESGLAGTNPLTGVSIQSALPLLLRGSAAAMTNLSDPLRYNLLGIPNNSAGNSKADSYLNASAQYPFPDKKNRELLQLQYKNMSDTLAIFANPAIVDFNESANTFVDDVNTDGDTAPYYLFPTSNSKNGGYPFHAADADPNKDRTKKYVVDTATASYSFFTQLKAAALILNKTDAIIAGTELGGFDTHSAQGGVTGSHPNLQRRIAWALYALRKYFLKYGKNGSAGDTSAMCSWDDVVVVTLSEFGRTTGENGTQGTDHAEADLMFAAGGNVNGGIKGCHTGDSIPWVTGPSGSMFGVQSRYLKRIYDYRSLLGELIRDHLGATQNQLNNIIPGYADSGEHLQTGGASSIDGTSIVGEAGIV